jgi:ubiquinone biosynthesis protein COQ9
MSDVILMLQKPEVFSAKASRVKPYSKYCEALITRALDASGFPAGEKR